MTTIAPFFMFGFERSGTTLLSMIVGAHPDIAVPLSVTGMWFRYGAKLDTYNNLETHEDVERIVDKTSHAVADIYGVVNRGYVREGYFADLILINPDKPTPVTQNSLLAKCHWSPFEGHTFRAAVDTTIVNGTVVWEKGELTGEIAGTPLEFKRAR